MSALTRCPLPDGGRHVATPAFRLAQQILTEASTRAALVGVFGDPGNGKTHSVAYWVEHNELEFIWVTPSYRPTVKEIYEEFLIATTGQCDDVSARKLRRECEEVLAERPRVVVVDEAQNLGKTWLQQLRGLHDDARARWTLVLVGGYGCAEKLKTSPELWSRLDFQVDFPPLGGALLLETLRAYHPLLARTDTELLVQVDKRFCRGNMRSWTKLLEAARPLLPRTSTPDRLSEKAVRGAFVKLGVG